MKISSFFRYPAFLKIIEFKHGGFLSLSKNPPPNPSRGGEKGWVDFTSAIELGKKLTATDGILPSKILTAVPNFSGVCPN